MKTSSLASIERGRTGLELQKHPIPKELPLFDLSGNFLGELHSQDLSSFDLPQRLLSANSSIPSVFMEKISSNYLMSQLHMAVIPAAANKRLNKTVKRKIWGVRYP